MERSTSGIRLVSKVFKSFPNFSTVENSIDVLERCYEEYNSIFDEEFKNDFALFMMSLSYKFSKKKRTIYNYLTELPSEQSSYIINKYQTLLEHLSLPNIPILGSFVDPRDFMTYRTVVLNDGNTWLAQNLQFDVGDGCKLFNDNPKNEKKYGRLYSWEAALSACPSGWRLPTSKEFGKILSSHRDKKGRNEFKNLVNGGNSGFDAELGGQYRQKGKVFNQINNRGEFYNLGIEGEYWCNSNKTHWSCLFNRHRHTQIHWWHGNVDSFYSCRCIKK